MPIRCELLRLVCRSRRSRPFDGWQCPACREPVLENWTDEKKSVFAFSVLQLRVEEDGRPTFAHSPGIEARRTGPAETPHFSVARLMRWQRWRKSAARTGFPVFFFPFVTWSEVRGRLAAQASPSSQIQSDKDGTDRECNSSAALPSFWDRRREKVWRVP